MDLVYFINAITPRLRFYVKLILNVKLVIAIKPIFNIKFMLDVTLSALYFSTRSFLYVLKLMTYIYYW